MPVTARSFAKINLGLRIGALRPDGFHELHTVYQTIALCDTIRVAIARGSGVEVRCNNARVPTDETNTCQRIANRATAAFKSKGRVIIEIEKHLPVQGGLGGASSNAIATLLALERELNQQLSGPEKLRIAAEVGSDLPLFLIGGTVLGVGRGEEVYPLLDLPSTHCVVATPAVGVSTPQAFADWDQMTSLGVEGAASARCKAAKLTPFSPSDRMNAFARSVSWWLSGSSQGGIKSGRPVSGVPASGRGRAETPLLDLVRTGIENDFERVVFPKYPELRDVKYGLERAGAVYASLSGSGSAVCGLFRTGAEAEKAAGRLRENGIPAKATTTLTREQYWKRIFD